MQQGLHEVQGEVRSGVSPRLLRVVSLLFLELIFLPTFRILPCPLSWDRYCKGESTPPRFPCSRSSLSPSSAHPLSLSLPPFARPQPFPIISFRESTRRPSTFTSLSLSFPLPTPYSDLASTPLYPTRLSSPSLSDPPLLLLSLLAYTPTPARLLLLQIHHIRPPQPSLLARLVGMLEVDRLHAAVERLEDGD